MYMLNENIKNLRTAKGLSQEQLAQKLHVVRQTVSKWEKGLSVPDAAILIALADALDTTVSTLLGNADTADTPAADQTAETAQPTVQQLAAQLEALNARFAARCETSRKRWRLFFILLAVVVVVAVLFNLVCAAFLWGMTEQRDASIGIIGGADGPTAIFVSHTPAPLPSWLVLAALAVTAGIGLYKTRKK